MSRLISRDIGATWWSHVCVVTGGRDFAERTRIIDLLEGEEPSVLIHGQARGADTFAGNSAKALGIPTIEVPALWDEEGIAAGPRRNARMIDIAWALWATAWEATKHSTPTLLAFPGGRGTADMVSRCKEHRWRIISG